MGKVKTAKKASVVSAVYVVTDLLLSAANKAKDGLDIIDSIASIRKKHFNIIDDLFKLGPYGKELKVNYKLKVQNGFR